MNKLLTITIICVLYSNYSFSLDGPQFKIGGGGGINFTNIADKNSYPLTNTSSGMLYTSEYSGLFSNPGYQLFVHGELAFRSFSLALKPGYYKYSFKKTDQAALNSGIVYTGAKYSLGYIGVPLEAKWYINWGKNNPYFGGAFSYAFLLRQGGDANNSFKRSKFAVGPIFGIDFKFDKFDLIFSSGYEIGLNYITKAGNNENSTTVPYLPQNIKHNNLNFSLSILFSTGKSNFRKSLDCPKIQRQ